MEDGYYYLNNFDNVLNSFGECRDPGGVGGGHSLGLSPAGPRGGRAGLSAASPSPAVGTTVSVPSGPEGA